MTTQILEFLTELGENNNREWFNANKNRYEIAKNQFEVIVELLIGKIGEFDKEIYGQEAKKCIFRLHRDVRFGHDKRPFKTNFGAFFAKDGRKSIYSGYYIHLDPTESFVGGGIYMPANDVLKKIRTAIFNNIHEFKDIVFDEAFRATFKEFMEEKLVNPPKGFPKDFEDIELLKFKSYVVGRTLTDSELGSAELLDICVDAFEKLYELNRFLNNAIDS